MRNMAVAVTIAVLCTEVGKPTCDAAGLAVDAWNEAAGRQLFMMSETHPTHGPKIMLKRFLHIQGSCGMHGVTKDDDNVSVIYVNTAAPFRCNTVTTLLHEFGHRLGLAHDLKPYSRSIMRVPTRWGQLKPAPIDIERLNGIEKERGRTSAR